jgi:hypothetical protein
MPIQTTPALREIDDLLSRLFNVPDAAIHVFAKRLIRAKKTSDEISAMGFSRYADMPMFSKRSQYSRSVWVARPSDRRAVPEILLLAVLAHGSLNNVTRVYWTDGDSQNNTINNVSVDRGLLVQPKPRESQATARVIRNKYGAPSGTREYWKRYWADPANVKRNRDASRRYQEKKRIAARQQRTTSDFDALRARVLGTVSNDVLDNVDDVDGNSTDEG